MKQDYSVNEILNAVDDILKAKSLKELDKKISNEIHVKDILNAVDNILKVKTIEEPTKPADNIQKNIAGDVHKNIVDINRLNLIHSWKIAMSKGNIGEAELIKKKLNLPK